jgi:alpha-methylacyl-CoA racemase
MLRRDVHWSRDDQKWEIDIESKTSARTTPQSPVRGPLSGLRVIEFSSIGPGPHCAMLLTDLGADVVRFERAGGNGWPNPILDRGRATMVVDIHSEQGRAVCLDASDRADVVIEGFRPGVMERLGLGPEVLLTRNPGLVYGRVTGWGQTGPLAKSAGHDINYIAVTGALAAMGRCDEPVAPPLNLVGDIGGGSMFLAFGILAALYERQRSGRGQVVDAAIIDGVTSMMTVFAGLVPSNRISLDHDRNPFSGAAPFYRCYVCADGRQISIGPLEPRFYKQLLEAIGAPDLLESNDDRRWAGQGAQLADIFRTRTADDWRALLEGTDACFAPVLHLSEAPEHPQIKERGTYVEHEGQLQAAPAPRFSRTPGTLCGALDAQKVLAGWIRR